MTDTPGPDPELLAVAEDWARQDPDDRDRALLEAEIVAARAGDPLATASLTSRFAGPLAFGTAGLRAEEGPGPARMNRAVVRRTAAGLARYLLARLGDARGDGADAARPPRVVVGYDARRGSERFALDSVAVFAAAGLEAVLMPRPLPTPVLAFAVRHLDADAGVMVTASHNPPADNGYKVYLGGRMTDEAGRGAQITTPSDAEIAGHIDHAARLESIPLAPDGWTVLDEGIVGAYRLAARVVLATPDHSVTVPARHLDVVYTPLHGVGGAVLPDLFEDAGFARPYVVPEQAEPDPAFPTVAFPNPEEPGAMDLALAAAAERGADLVIANDPDADRLALAVPVPQRPDRAGTGGPGWRMLTGDEVGVLLGHQLIDRLRPTGAVMASSVVSSRLLSRLAAELGVTHETTLTGFKWIGRVPGLGYGYEEALGYCVAPDLVRDKDGMTAALVAAEMAASLAAEGRTLLDVLDAIALQFGVTVTGQLSLRVADTALLEAMMTRLRVTPPTSLAGHDVTAAVDLSQGYRGLPATDALMYTTADDSRVVVRPSGTEPKLKCYLEVVRPVDSAADLPTVRAEAGAALEQLERSVAEALGQ
ncbi:MULTISPECIES: phospho-sugar mutase [Micrococcaceae]|uniref:phospho-sugar mutase n=2 Tax=Micrococcales TaxID=85006 RepID=UPI001614E471|nr:MULTISPECIES: phospho-sugar mutase [Micrococcaceae]MBB5748114.1 phosphomannomutase [Micrococcus sp. TA1]HRO30460.1 phospho-sugar mutase [Citricoccus sp.]